MSASRRVPALILALLACASIHAQDARKPSAPSYEGAPEPLAVPDLDARLRALEGEAPMRYFELAEEIAREFSGDAGRDLARNLFVLAFELSRDESGVPTLTRSVCLALAELEPGDTDRRRWLRAIAALEDDDSPDAQGALRETGVRERIAVALSHFRAEEYLKARTQLNRPAVQRFISRLGGAEKQLVDRVIHEVDRDAACEVCRNDRTVPDRSREGRRGDQVLCPRCQGNPGPRLTAEEYRRLLVFEIGLLGVQTQRWDAQLDVDDGAPLREASPDRLPRLFDVDPRAVIYTFDAQKGWRSGGWIRPGADPDGMNDR